MQRNITDENIDASIFTLGILNSYILDFVLRKLITINVNQTYLKQLPIPIIEDTPHSAEIIQIVKRLLMLNGDLYDELDILIYGSGFETLNYEQLVAELNGRVAIVFDLEREELINLLKTFESANHRISVQQEAQRIIEVYDRLKEGE